MEASGQGAKAADYARCAALLLEAGADVRHAAKDGSTAMHAAAEGGSVACLELLRRHDAPLDAADAAGRTPLEGAAAGRAPHPDCILYLLQEGAAVPSERLVSITWPAMQNVLCTCAPCLRSQ